MKISEQFALDQWLTDYPENLTYQGVLDLLHGDSEEWTHELITVWQTVEDCTLWQIAGFIEDTKRHFERITKGLINDE